MESKIFLYRLLREIRGEAVYLYGVRVGAILLQSVTLFIVAAAIGIEEFGRFVFMFSASQVATVILGAGSPLFLQRVLPARDVGSNGVGNSNIVATCFLRTFVLTCFGIGILLFIEWHMYGAIRAHARNEALLILLTGFLLSSLNIFIAVVRVARSATYSMLLRDLFPYIFFLTGLGISVSFGYRSAEVSLLIFCGALLISTVTSIVSARNYLVARMTREIIDGPEIGRYWAFWGLSIAGAGLAQADILLARVFLDDRLLGIYALLRRASNLISMPQVIANWTISVRVAKDFELGDKVALQRHAVYGVMLALPIATMLLLVIGVSSPFWIALFHINPTVEVVVLLSVLLFAQLINVLAGANALFALQCREESYILKARVLSLVIGVVSMSMGALLFGSMGIALGTLLSMAILNSLLLYHVKKNIGIWTSIPLTFFKRR